MYLHIFLSLSSLIFKPLSPRAISERVFFFFHFIHLAHSVQDYIYKILDYRSWTLIMDNRFPSYSLLLPFLSPALLIFICCAVMKAFKLNRPNFVFTNFCGNFREDFYAKLIFCVSDPGY